MEAEDKKIVISIRENDWSLETELDPATVVFILELVKNKVVTDAAG